MLALRFLFRHIFRSEIYSKWKTVDIYELLIVTLGHKFAQKCKKDAMSKK